MPTLSVYAAGLQNPQDISIDTSLNVYVANAGNNSILKIPNAGTGKGGTPSVIGAGQNPTSVCVDASGNVFSVFETKNTLYKNNQPFISSHHIKQPTAVTTDASGNIYISCAGNNEILYVTAT